MVRDRAEIQWKGLIDIEGRQIGAIRVESRVVKLDKLLGYGSYFGHGRNS